ncbi:hypothetical protein SEA_DRE3_62 [Gordonia phage Dre3]|uniref:Uncharacterized protein n=1 Tax=Gordonia phage Gibbous TaxID=2652405 RepID=A0A5J6T550_9CAUD|nr:hypothetical protein QLQ74_gp62 [Gordonia phage Gibbous]QFG05138.1 hypothetical protein SEA_GIBBOUS_62 [Gordonia phage Gibbous]QRI45991.1 hypothetical protein SEA_DRE3_62 [Gordonia phage Dre3]
MARRRKSDGTSTGHSATDNGWFIPTGVAVSKVEDHARKLWDKADPWDGDQLRAIGRVEGMAIALAILKGSTAKDELKRIKYGRPGSPEERAGNV